MLDNTNNQSVSLVICTCDMKPSIVDTLNSVNRQSIQPDEIIVVHQGKFFHRLKQLTDRLCPDARVLHDDDYGLSRSRNIAISISSSYWLAYTDDDVVLSENWVKEIKASIAKDPDIGILGGKIIPKYTEKNLSFNLSSKWEYLLPAYTKEYKYGPYKDNDMPAGANLVIARKVFADVGLFKLDLGLKATKKQQIYGEDTYFCQQAKNRGHKVTYNPNLVVEHPVPADRQNHRHIKNRLISEGYTRSYILFNYTKKNRVKIIKHAKNICVKLIKSAVKKDLEAYIALGQIKYLIHNSKQIFTKEPTK